MDTKKNNNLLHAGRGQENPQPTNRSHDKRGWSKKALLWERRVIFPLKQDEGHALCAAPTFSPAVGGPGNREEGALTKVRAGRGAPLTPLVQQVLSPGGMVESPRETTQHIPCQSSSSSPVECNFHSFFYHLSVPKNMVKEPNLG